MSVQNKYEEVLNIINDTQKTLDEIFFWIDDHSINELKLGLALVNLEKANTFTKLAKDNIKQEGGE